MATNYHVSVYAVGSKKKDFIMEESFKEISMEKMLQNI